MRVFHFPLSRLLDFRRGEEDRRAQTLADARRESDSAQRARKDLVEIQEAGRAKLAEAHSVGGSIGILRNMEFVLERMGDHVKDADQVCHEADEKVVESIEHYTQAARDRHSLDRLKDRRMEEWKVEESRREQNEIDEIAITRHGRRLLESPGS